MTEVEFLGGPVDGQIMDIPHPPPPIWQFPAAPMARYLRFDDPIEEATTYNLVSYRLARRYDDSRVYVFDELTDR